MIDKGALYQHCEAIAREKVERLTETLADLRDSAANETKSTAGDKHETALAMLQIEQANIGKQLEEAQELYLQLTLSQQAPPADIVVKGSLVKTNLGYFYVTVALGKIMYHGLMVFVLSPGSPLGQKLIGRKVGDAVTLNERGYRIESIA